MKLSRCVAYQCWGVAKEGGTGVNVAGVATLIKHQHRVCLYIHCCLSTSGGRLYWNEVSFQP